MKRGGGMGKRKQGDREERKGERKGQRDGESGRWGGGS